MIVLGSQQLERPDGGIILSQVQQLAQKLAPGATAEVTDDLTYFLMTSFMNHIVLVI